MREGTPAGRVRREVELPFLDRVQATERIRTELREARRTRRARVLIVEGEPGIGKSRLAGSFRASLRGVTWLPGRCPPYGQHLPMFALADGVRWLLQLPAGGWDESDVRVRERAEPLIRGDVRRFLRQVRVLTGGDERAAPRPIGTSEPADASARAVVEALAGRRPVVVELDDLQWADADLLRMLSQIHAEPWQGPLLFLGMVRRDPPGELGRLPTVRLDSIPARDMGDLVSAVVGRGLPSDVRDALFERAEGNPLFLQEGARMLVESGALRTVDGEWTLVDRRALARVPETLRALVAARIDGLEPVERTVLQDAAVHGDRAPEQGLEELHGGPVHDVVERLVARDLLIRDDDPEVVRFRHRVVRDVAYDRLTKAERARRHRLVGERLAMHGSPTEPGQAAHHFEQAWLLGRTKPAPAGDPDDASAAARWLITAGGQAFAHLPAAAEDLFGRAAAAARAARRRRPAGRGARRTRGERDRDRRASGGGTRRRARTQAGGRPRARRSARACAAGARASCLGHERGRARPAAPRGGPRAVRGRGRRAGQSVGVAASVGGGPVRADQRAGGAAVAGAAAVRARRRCVGQCHGRPGLGVPAVDRGRARLPRDAGTSSSAGRGARRPSHPGERPAHRGVPRVLLEALRDRRAARAPRAATRCRDRRPLARGRGPARRGVRLRPRPSRPRPPSRWSPSCSRSPAPPAPTICARWR